MNKLIIFFAFIGITAMNVASAQIYREDDKEGLRVFLRQPSAETGKINAEQLGLQIGDTLDWQTGEAWVEKIEALAWNDESPKRLIEIYVGSLESWPGPGNNLAGILDASKWSKLTRLQCTFNALTVSYNLI